jgi:hypothetical protein
VARTGTSAPAGTRAHHIRRAIAHWSRVLHTYLSMASFSILFFFAATGITLNHQDKLNGDPKVSRFTGHLDAALVAPGAASLDRRRSSSNCATRTGSKHISATSASTRTW